MTSKLRKMVGLFLVATSLLIPSKVSAWGENFGWNSCDPCNPCNPCEDVCCYPGPLTECAFSVLVKGGVVPTTWHNRGTIYAVNPTVAPPIVFSIGKTPKFDDVFDLPWTVGGEVAYNVSDRAQVFLEANYLNAEGKRHSHTIDGTNLVLSHRHRDASAWTGYLGARYYFSRSWLCDRVAPFVGFKAGFIHHKRANSHVQIAGIDVSTQSFFLGETGVSAGAQIGLDVQIWDCIYAVLNFEVVFSQARRVNNNIVIVPPVGAGVGGITNLNVGCLGKEVSYPITLGLRYQF